MIKNVEKVIETVSDLLTEFTDTAIVGMSGGADSTLVACLCVDALGKDNVVGVHMPASEIDVKTFNSDSIEIATKLGIDSVCFDMRPSVDALYKSIDAETHLDISKLNLGNIKARLRMTTLYTLCTMIAEDTGNIVRVIGTGNLSEDFIGYDTKGGDALADIFPIGDLFKSEVYQMLEWYHDKGWIKEGHIGRIPSAGLWEGQTDEGELGYSYDEMEPSIRRLFDGEAVTEISDIDKLSAIDKFVLERHLMNTHKHEAPQIIELRKLCD